MARKFDLLGDPIPDNHGKVGRNGHIATNENINKVRLLTLANWTASQIAEELGISVPTLNAHYFRNTSIKRARQHVVSEVRGRLLLQLEAQAAKGSVSALKEMGRIVHRAELEMLGAELTGPKAPVKRPGKKAQRKIDAAKSDGQWGFLPNVAGDKPLPN